MGRKLGGNAVHVHTDDGGVVIYNPGDEVPDKHAKLISNESVWDQESESTGDSIDEAKAMLIRMGVPMTPELEKALGGEVDQTADAGPGPSSAAGQPPVNPGEGTTGQGADGVRAIDALDADSDDQGDEDPPPAGRRGGRRS